MNFEYNEEQKMLKESMHRWFQDNYSFDQRRVILDSEEGFSREHWATFAELGWLSIPFAEEYGGYGGSIIDTAAIMEEAGKALLLEPLATNLVFFGGLLQKAGGDVAAELIPQVIDGSLIGSLATYESQARYDLSDIRTTASKDGDDYVLSGAKAMALSGAQADKFIVSARTSGDAKDEAGITLFVIEKDAAGLTVKNDMLMDGQRVADLELNNVKASAVVGDVDGGYALLDAVMQDAHVALGAEAVGIMQLLNATTVEYTKTRKQFGVPISVFQALQHRMVDCFMAAEQTKSMLYGALCELTDGITSETDARQSVLALRALVAKYGKQCADEAIQMHGGMGLTDELNIGHYAKRMLMINLQFGNGDLFQQQYNELAYS